LASPAINTACGGVRVLVTTTVAMEFAASWNPLRKSNVSANVIITITIISVGVIGIPFMGCKRLKTYFYIKLDD
jgi:hypothetical protein